MQGAVDDRSLLACSSPSPSRFRMPRSSQEPSSPRSRHFTSLYMSPRYQTGLDSGHYKAWRRVIEVNFAQLSSALSVALRGVYSYSVLLLFYSTYVDYLVILTDYPTYLYLLNRLPFLVGRLYLLYRGQFNLVIQHTT